MPSKTMWLLGCSGTLLFLTAILIVAGIGWPVLAPVVLELGRMHRAIKVGDPAGPIWADAQSYCDRRAGGEAHCSRGMYTPSLQPMWQCADGSTPVSYIAVYDWVLMDDIQLHVELDADDRVCASVFWAD